MEEGHGVARKVLEVLGEAATAVQPRKRPFDDPALGDDLEASGLIRSLHDLDREARQGLLYGALELRPLVAAVGKQFAQEREQAEQGVEDQHAAVTVLDVRRMDDAMQQEAYRIDQDVPLLALDLLACVIAARVDAGPPFSALLMLWLSITHAVGLASRPICSRHFT